MYNQTLQIRLKVFGNDSLDVANTQKNIADIRSAQAQYDEAVKMCQRGADSRVGA
jgi:hypothetical protein